MNGALFFLRPVIAMVLMLIFLSLISFNQDHLSSRYTVFIFLIVLRLNVYPLLGSGWASNRKYAFIGGLRAAAQTISYEISLAFILLRITLIWKSMSLIRFLVKGQIVGYLLPAILIRGVWLITVVAELNRTPFDFAEGESELVSGFNIEYGSEKFAIIFLAEYGIIYIFSFLTAIMLINITPAPHSFTAFVGILISFFIIWLRATLPRFRYDLLILLTWKSILPVSLGACQLIILVYRRL